MKYILSVILLLILTPLIAQSEMDTIKINYSAHKVSMSKVFTELESEYGIRFSYATSAILDQTINVDFRDENIGDVLDYLLSDQNLEYKVISNNILIRKNDVYLEDQNSSYLESIHLKGRVIQPGQNKEGLDLATIAVSNTTIGTYTDEEGRFDIEIPGDHLSEELIFHALGYEDIRYKITEVKDSYVMVAMDFNEMMIDEITIVNREKPIRMDSKNNSIGINDIQLNSKTSGLGGSDFSKQVQLLPGIAAHNDTSSEIKIRGASSDATMVILDGLPLYHSSHYYGIFSSINTSFIDSVNIYKNNYPLQYDGKTGGVVELFSTNRQVEKIEGNIELNLLTSSADITIPVTKSTMIQLAGRTTIGNVSNSQFNTFASESNVTELITDFNEPRQNQSSDPEFNFYDLNASLQSRFRQKDLLSISFYKSTDQLSNLYNSKLKNNQNDRLELQANEKGSWQNIAVGIEYQMNLTKFLQWNTGTHYTRYDKEITNDYRLEKIAHSGLQEPMITINNPRSKQINNLSDLGIDSHVHYSKGGHNIQLGICGTLHDLKYKIEENKKDLFEGGKLFYESAIYASYNSNLTDRIRVNTGLRASYFDLNKASYISPRALFNFKLTESITTKASYGYYQQVIRQFYYEYRGEPMALWISAGQNGIPVLKSHNMMLGATANLGSFTLDVELYQKQLKGMIEYAVLDPGNGSSDPNEPREYSLFKGDGYSQGIDIMISTGYNHYDTYLSYTLSKSAQRFKAIAMNDFFPAEDDRRHQLKWVNMLKTGKLSWGLNVIFVSGRRYTDIENIGAQGNITETPPELRFTRLPAYQRIDMSATYDFKISKVSSSLSIALFNTFNNQNVKYVQSVSTDIQQNSIPVNTVIGNESNLLGRTLNLSWHIGF